MDLLPELERARLGDDLAGLVRLAADLRRIRGHHHRLDPVAAFLQLLVVVDLLRDIRPLAVAGGQGQQEEGRSGNAERGRHGASSGSVQGVRF